MLLQRSFSAVPRLPCPPNPFSDSGCCRALSTRRVVPLIPAESRIPPLVFYGSPVKVPHFLPNEMEEYIGQRFDSFMEVTQKIWDLQTADPKQKERYLHLVQVVCKEIVEQKANHQIEEADLIAEIRHVLDSKVGSELSQKEFAKDRLFLANIIYSCILSKKD